MSDMIIKGWLTSGNHFEQYNIEIDRKDFHSGQQSLKISRVDTEVTAGDFATIMQQINAQNYIGKRIRLSAYVKTKDVEGAGGIWLRIDGDQFKQLKLDNMQDRPIVGTNDWNYYSCVLDVSQEAKIINFGALLAGTGELWADDFLLETVTNDIPTTDIKFEEAYPTEPQNLSFEE